MTSIKYQACHLLLTSNIFSGGLGSERNPRNRYKSFSIAVITFGTKTNRFTCQQGHRYYSKDAGDHSVIVHHRRARFHHLTVTVCFSKWHKYVFCTVKLALTLTTSRGSKVSSDVGVSTPDKRQVSTGFIREIGAINSAGVAVIGSQ